MLARHSSRIILPTIYFFPRRFSNLISIRHTPQNKGLSMHSDPSELKALQKDWTEMYRTTLPGLARKKAAVQNHWPVSLDHCFARIILDNAEDIGNGTRPWMEVVKAPAVGNMTTTQLVSAIDLGQKIASGKANLVELDNTSLAVRGKTKKRKRGDEAASTDTIEGANIKNNSKANNKANLETSSETNGKKGDVKVNTHKAEAAKMWSTFHGRAQDGITSKATQATETEEGTPLENVDADTGADVDIQSTTHVNADGEVNTNANRNAASTKSSSQNAIPGTGAALEAARDKIQNSTMLTPFRKHVLTLLTQVPRGQYTTYKAMADAAARIPIPSHFEKKGHVPLNPANNNSSRTSGASTKSNKNRSAEQNKSTKVAPGAARAVGLAMRDNPYAPTVPCHRVLAADGRLGGYKGERDAAGEGKFQTEKRRILREEGVRFDSSGKVLGSPFVAFA